MEKVTARSFVDVRQSQYAEKSLAPPHASNSTIDSLESSEKSTLSTLLNQLTGFFLSILNFIKTLLYSLVTNTEAERLKPLLNEMDGFYDLMTYHDPLARIATNVDQIKTAYTKLSAPLKEMLHTYLKKSLSKEDKEATSEEVNKEVETCGKHFRAAVLGCHADLLTKVGIR